MKWYYVLLKRNVTHNDASCQTLSSTHNFFAKTVFLIASLFILAGIFNFTSGGVFPYRIEFPIGLFAIIISSRYKGLASWNNDGFTMTGLRTRTVKFSEIVLISEVLCDSRAIEEDAKDLLVVKTTVSFFPFNIHLLTIPSSSNLLELFHQYSNNNT